jgi:hypothetical protein
MIEAEKYILEVWGNKRNQAVANKLKKELLDVAAWIKENEEHLGVTEDEISDVIKEALEYIIKRDMHQKTHPNKKLEEIGSKVRHAFVETALWIFKNKDWLWIDSYEQVGKVMSEALDYL